MTEEAVSTAAPVVQAAEVAGNVAAHDMSMFGLFMQADWIVKSIIVGLLFASFWSWKIIFEKSMRYKQIRLRADKFEQDFWSADALDEFYDRVKRRANHPYAVVFLAAMEEWARSEKGGRRTGLRTGIQERMAQIMSVARNRELNELERGIGFLATVGTSAPFIGLFGTVWGIMNSFQSIALSKNTSLAVVAPGIAEALFATAIGLFAAIPAVIAYNRLSNELAKFSGRLEDFCIEFSALLSRQSDV